MCNEINTKTGHSNIQPDTEGKASSKEESPVQPGGSIRKETPDIDKDDPSKRMPDYDKNEKWVQEHIKEFGKEPGFF